MSPTHCNNISDLVSKSTHTHHLSITPHSGPWSAFHLLDLLDRAGFRPVDRHEIVKEKSVEELNAQLVSLVGNDSVEMLISAFKSRRSISGPELAE